MKTSIEWLQEYTDIKVSPKELADILTMTGSKVETIESQGKEIKNVVIGKILEIQKHPDADKLVVTRVDIKEEILQIVTGASNIKVADIVPIAKVGANLPGGITIKPGKLRGIDSFGMMCSVGELGLDVTQYPDQIEHGIMILDKSLENRLGEDVVEVLQLRQDILDFEITPNRPDCLSIEGLGRETAISLKEVFKNPRKNIDEMEIPTKDEIEGLSVEITAPDLCYRYLARVVENVKIQPSPDWMVRRLKACGVRSINNIVDITNYVMLEMGQPLHAFDIQSIEGKKITVRRAKPEEKIITLDKQERILEENMLVIADTKKPVAIAGVMGGLNSEIEENTTKIVFESAVFSGGSVRKTAKKVGLRTEASSRFEKGLSAENALRAINRAVELVELLGAGKAIPAKIDNYPTKQKQRKIPIEPDRINALLGLNVTKEEMIQIFEQLEIKIQNDEAIPPYFRQDLEQEADLAEEVLRFYGYDKLQTTLMDTQTTIGVKNKKQKQEEEIRNLLVAKGLSEICTYGFINFKDMEKINLLITQELEKQIIHIQNPISEEYTIMRIETISSMMKALANNASKKNENIALFEIARTYQNKKEAIENKEIPEENTYITIGIYGKQADFYQIKGVVENILEIAGVNSTNIQAEKENPSYHPGRTANFCVGNDIIATCGQIHPKVQQNYDINQEVIIAQIQLEKLVKYGKNNKRYVEIPKYPAVERDIAILVQQEIPVGDIERIIQKKGKKILESVELFDVYQNEKLGQNKKSVAYALKFRDKNKTLTDEQINPVMQEIVEELEKTLGAELRK